MNISHLLFKGIKGMDFDESLAPFTLIVGSNASGKTSVFDAITVGLAGLHPKLPKRNSDVMRLGVGDELKVVMSLQDELSGETTLAFRRLWREDGGVRVETENIPDYEPVLLDPMIYFGASEKERVRMAFNMAKVQESMNITQYIEALNCPPETPLAEFQKIKAMFCVKCKRQSNESYQEWLERVADEAKKRRNECQSAIRKLEATHETIAGMETSAQPDLEEIESRLNDAKKKLEESLLNLGASSPDTTNLEAKKNELLVQIRTTEQEVARLLNEKKKLSINPSCPTCGHKRSAEDVEFASNGIDIQLDNKDSLMKELHSKLNGLEVQIKNIAKTPDKKAEKAVLKTREQVAEIQVEYDEANAQKARLETAQKAAALNASLAIELSIAKGILSLVEGAQNKAVFAAFSTLLNVANRIVKPVLGFELQYTNNEVGRFVKYKGKQGWVSSSTFSGAEQVVTYAAISIALASQSALKLVLIDELGRLDRLKKSKLFRAIANMINEGTISQFIGIDAEPNIAADCVGKAMVDNPKIIALGEGVAA